MVDNDIRPLTADSGRAEKISACLAPLLADSGPTQLAVPNAFQLGRTAMKKSLGAKSLICPAPVWCVGTYDNDGKPSVATIAWGGICCSSPPSVTICLRKATYTYGNIMARKAYTLSAPPTTCAKEADFFGMASGFLTDENRTPSSTTPKSTE
jgi:flavin reductase (DIM6/NTAB) family NADH-FMN oxidoreductase RutF